VPGADQARARLKRFLPDAESDKRLLAGLQQRIKAYYRGKNADFSDIRVVLTGLSDFTQDVLNICRTIGYAKRTTYLDIAKRLSGSGSARAVGSALARNPLPLIIPCHRVVRSDGAIGGFSAAGGKNLKEKMLSLEENAPKTPKT